MDYLPRVRRHNLPVPRTSFVGREREVWELVRTLAAARDIANAYPAGAWFVELAALEQEALVPQDVAEALGVRLAAAREMRLL